MLQHSTADISEGQPLIRSLMVFDALATIATPHDVWPLASVGMAIINAASLMARGAPPGADER